MVEEDGFEPSKSETTDLQSAPFGRSGTPPNSGAGDGTRTRDLLITSQLLYQLSYTSANKNSKNFYLLNCFGGNNRDRTCDPLLVRQVLSQLSYAPIIGDP
ncbi:MAG: hypothetical protein K0Q99_1591 [Clostridia bacterium]|nr:hypothetical protein [Clostridia bacterium]